jgi:hypothetical protein
MVRNIVIFVLLLILSVLFYKYHSALDDLSAIKNKIGTNDMTLFKESEGIFSIISKDNKLKVILNQNSYGLNSFAIFDELSNKQVYFNFSEDGELSCYSYKDSKYTVETNVYFHSYRDKFIERVELLNDYETFYEFFDDGTTQITIEDITR